MSDADIREELRELLATRAFTYGDFVLTSGRRSDYYVDGKQVTLDGRGLHLVAMLALQRCRELGVTAVGGLTLGADPIAAAVAALSGGGDDALTAFIVRKEVKAHGTGRAIEGPPLRPGQRVMLVDDTLTTGGTFLQAQERVRETGAVVAEALCVVDREEGGADALRAAGIPLLALFRRSEFPAPHAALRQTPRG
ncbi:MAG: orotate phosphoribosyltransferase [Candidatus Dormibacteraeota bacterium]|nr:orotate phosphoribosyltransferase [Candidatus Dormibacteraeota bacterium]MBV9524250.1 orotate phosphoribosyltransferase [Candidatus Dormibacteraeota bacterium]